MIKAIETKYNGYRFRSRLEARWAVFFDTLGVKYEYEKEGYDLDGTWYLPDFWLPDVNLRDYPDGLWYEIKPPRWHGQAPLSALGEQTQHCVVLAEGLPGDYDYSERLIYECWPSADEPMFWLKCRQCGHVKVEFMEGSYKYCPRCKAEADDDCPDIIRAVEAAKGARFEYGESGAPAHRRHVIPMWDVKPIKLEYAKCPLCSTPVFGDPSGQLRDQRTLQDHKHE